MSTAGYNGREFKVLLGTTVIAAIQNKTGTFNRSGVDVTTDDDDGWRRLLPTPASRSVDASVEGVATTNNYEDLLTEWEGNVISDITLEAPNGDVFAAADGFFFGNLELSGAQDGHVAFTLDIQSSGEVTRTPAV